MSGSKKALAMWGIQQLTRAKEPIPESTKAAAGTGFNAAVKSARNPRGSGRKPSPPELKKIQLGLKLPGWLIAWLRAQPGSMASLIEDALIARHGLVAPVSKIDKLLLSKGE